MNVRELGVVIAVVFILVFIATAVMALLSVGNVIKISRAHRNVLFGKLLLEVVSAVFFLFYKSFSDIAYIGTIAGVDSETTVFAKDVYYGPRMKNGDIEWISRREDVKFSFMSSAEEPVEGTCHVRVNLEKMKCGHYIPSDIEFVYDRTSKRLQVMCNGAAAQSPPMPCLDSSQMMGARDATMPERSALRLLSSIIGTALAQGEAGGALSAMKVDQYVRLLGSPDPQLRYSAIEDLVRFGEQSLPVLEKALAGVSRTARLNALAVMRISKWRPLNKISQKAFIDVVGALVADDEPIARETIKLLDTYLRGARQYLERPELVQDVFLDVVDAALKQRDTPPRALELLVKAGAVPQSPPPRFYELLGRALTHESAEVREESLQALASRPSGDDAVALLPKVDLMLRTEKSANVIDDAQRASAAIAAIRNQRRSRT